MKLPGSRSVLTMPGAEPFLYEGNDTGCLLIHGYTGTPFEMRMLGEFLRLAGYTVLAPRLFAHATRPEDMQRARWQDWMASVEDGLNLLKCCTSRQVVMGLSMGGILALLTASRFAVSGVAAFSAPYELPGAWRIKLVPLLCRIYPYVPKGASEWHNPQAAQDHMDYPAFPTRSLMELNALTAEMRSNLDKVSAPALFVQSRQDKSIPSESLDYLYAHVSSTEKTSLWLNHSGHVVIREPERDQVFQAVQQLLEGILDKK